MEDLLGRFADEAHGIDPPAIFQHFKVQIRPGRTPRLSHARHSLPFPNLITDDDKIFGVVSITGRISVTVIDFDHDAVAVTGCGPGYNAIRYSRDRVTELASKIDTGMVCRLTRERIGAFAKIRRYPA